MDNKMLYVIILIIFAGGFTAAWAATITLSGDADVTGNLNVDGTITGPTIDSLQTQINQITPMCPPESIQHWDKIKFFVTKPETGLPPKTIVRNIPNQLVLTSAPHPGADQETSFPPVYDIKVIDDPTKPVDLQQVVSDFLNARGYQTHEPNKQLVRQVIPADVAIADIEYAIVCTFPPT